MTAGLVAATGSLISFPTRAAPLSMKVGLSAPATHSSAVGLTAAATEIAKQTNGEVRLEVFPSGQLGSDQSMIAQTRQGSLELYMGTASILDGIVPNSAIWNTPFAFADYAAMWKAIDGQVGAVVRNAAPRAGLKAFDTTWDNGFRQISTANKPIAKVTDLKGLKVRVPVSAGLVMLFKAMNASPVALNFAELYPALQTKLVDGQENALSVFAIANFNEVQKYISMTNHVWDGYVPLTSVAFWKTIPADIQTIVANAINGEAKKQRQVSEALDKTLRATLAAKGVTFVDPDIAGFREHLRSVGFYKEWREKVGEAAWTALVPYAPGL
ncbi:Neu5Ac-binding protein (plasmid) [Variovorax sp. WDL1]|nr:Sialic acid-binding periplasmic protein SiaP [Variovorax sp. B2]PNG49272.1 Sialic acid-binding periplasmic protein SiaP [Variovorax sp. B4]VTV18458.1 Neu5Ac-binding protein [Variovorax sp. WDL1]